MNVSGRRSFGRRLTATLAVALVAGCLLDATAGTAEREASLPTLDAEASVQDYLQYAALNNAGLEAAFNRWKAALERIPQAKSLPDPRFNYTYFVEEVETRVGPQYTGTLLLPMGHHEYKFVVNDAWLVDPENLEWTPNDQGSLNSVLTVE